jgi:hypothetical protein
LDEKSLKEANLDELRTAALLGARSVVRGKETACKFGKLMMVAEGFSQIITEMGSTQWGE